MKLLIIDWDTFTIIDVLMQLNKRFIDYDVWQHKFVPGETDTQFEAEFAARAKTAEYAAVFSINFFSQISECAYKNGLKYISWSYDCPLNVVNIEKYLGYDTNCVFLFDRLYYEKYKNKGYKTVYHMPLGVNCDRLKKENPTDKEKMQYRADTAFIGRLYNNDYAKVADMADDYLKGYLEAIVRIQYETYGVYLIDELVTDKIYDMIKNSLLSRKAAISRQNMEYLLSYETTHRERIDLINNLASKCLFKLYSYESSPQIPDALNMGRCDYLYQMPRVIKSTKINLHQTVKGISSGIPLRCMDILGCGGLLLSNYQAELLDYFVPGEDIMIYESIEDACDKTAYLLSNENVISKISENGYRKVSELFSYDVQMEKIFKIAQIDL